MEYIFTICMMTLLAGLCLAVCGKITVGLWAMGAGVLGVIMVVLIMKKNET
ncbi:MAG: hypothetical protein M0Z56_05705 [Desulfobacteraceae bacterium]|nr:hypothetical protein [Desulfobacteraceae bacterium]